jgi:hypothetical protein
MGDIVEIGTLYYDRTAGEGKVGMKVGYPEMDLTIQKDIIGDYLRLLEDEYLRLTSGALK